MVVDEYGDVDASVLDARLDGMLESSIHRLDRS